MNILTTTAVSAVLLATSAVAQTASPGASSVDMGQAGSATANASGGMTMGRPQRQVEICAVFQGRRHVVQAQ